ncbi:MAG: A24 family peptidase [Actinomycetota bacterium]|nr:A24 family peptidase [Actinomycetota bacterium]
MTAAVVVLCAVLGVPAGMLANLLIERIPEKQPLRPLPAPGHLAGSTLQRLVIVATVALFTGTALRFQADWAVPAYLVFFVCLVSVSVIDSQRQIIPNRIVYPTIFASVPLLALAALAGGEWDRFWRALVGASLAWLALLVIHIIQPSGMGFGDVRLAFVLGLFLGWINLGHVVTGLFLGVLLISVVGLVLALLRLRSLQEHIAFGPFLAAGSTVAVFAGQGILRWWGGG